MQERLYDACIFDLDGTLLNTLPDLVELTNAVMRAGGYPLHTTEEVLSFVGGGVRVLLERALPDGWTEQDIDASKALWMELYPQYGYELTEPYPEMAETLLTLKDHGVKLGVLSNKFDAAARETIEAFFPGIFDSVKGESPDTPRKPDPTGLLRMIDELGSSPARCAYVGDSGATDMAVARAAGAYAIGATWGYQPTEALEKYGAQVLIDSPSQLVPLVLG